jgi:hypothetical protein
VNKILSIALFVVLIGQISKSQVLSDSAKISLLTCGSGNELYSVFGHSALHVSDPSNDINWVYNYGTFDFNTPNFYLKFANGNLNYLLSVGRFQYFLPGYFQEGRWVKAQILNLDKVEKQRLFDALQLNAKKENRDYRYDFFFDNCATRLRDQVFNAVSGEVALKDSIGQGLTYRQLYSKYLEKSPWIEFGIHLLLGVKADLKADAWHEMYLPEYLYYQFQNSQIVDANGIKKPLVLMNDNLILMDENKTETSLFIPFVVFLLFFAGVVALTFIGIKTKRDFYSIDLLLLVLSGLSGLLFVFLWFFTRHGVTAQNFNLMWALPTNIVLAFLWGLKSTINLGFTKYLTCATTALALIFVLGMAWFPQVFSKGLVFLVLSILTRLVYRIWSYGFICQKSINR